MTDKQSIASTNGRQFANFLLLASASCLIFMAPANAQTTASTVGVVVVVQGTVNVTSSAGATHVLVNGTTVSQGDTISTGSTGEMHAKLEDGGYLAVRPNSVVRIDRFSAKGDDADTTAFALLRGALRSVTGWVGKFHPQSYRISTSTATVGIRGTDHEIIYISAQEAKPGEVAGTHDSVNHGAAFVENAKGTVEVIEGHAGFATIGADKAPALHASIPNFVSSRRTGNDSLVDKHFAEIDKHIEGKLREHGVLKENEKYSDYVLKHAMAANTSNENSKRATEVERKKKPHHKIERP